MDLKHGTIDFDMSRPNLAASAQGGIVELSYDWVVSATSMRV